MIRFRSFLLLACLLAAQACAPSEEKSAGSAAPPGKVLVIGLDGADWEILDRLEAQGTIPNLARLRREGAWGVLQSESPMLSPILWTTIATGRGPTEHGILGFLTQRQGKLEPVRSDERRVRAFWNIASEAGRSVGVVGWYASWPAEPVRGFLVSDRAGTHQIAGGAAVATSGLAWPESLEPEIATLRGEIDNEIGSQAAARYFTAGGAGSAVIHVDQAPLDTFVGILRTTELYRRLTPRLIDRFRPDLTAVYFEGTDAVGHLYADAQAPAMPWLTPAQAAPAALVWDRYYTTVDTVVGELLQKVDPKETTVLVVSDHGFMTGPRRPDIPSRGPLGNQAPVWHRPEGVLVLWGRGVRSGVQLPAATLYDVLPTMFRLLELPLAQTLRGRPVDAALTQEVLAVTVRSVPDYESAGARETGTASAAEADAGEALAKLRSLGYVGSDTGAAQPPLPGPSAGQAGVPLNRYNEAMVLLQAKKPREALAVLKALQKDAPAFALGWFGEGMVRLEENNPQAAARALQHAVEAEPRLAPAHALLGEAYARLGRHDEALRACKEALRLESGNAKPALLAGSILVGSKRLAEAEPFFQSVKKAAPAGSADRARALAGLGVIARTQGRREEARASFEEALRDSPELPAALEGLAVLALERGEHGEALLLTERLVRATREDPRALTLQGQALAAAGRTGEAVAVLRRALAQRPDLPEARRLLSQLGAPPAS